MISEQRIIELGWEHSNEFDDEVKFSKDGLFAFANALQAELINLLGEPKAWTDKGNFGVITETHRKYLAEHYPKAPNDKTIPLYALPNEEEPE